MPAITIDVKDDALMSQIQDAVVARFGNPNDLPPADLVVACATDVLLRLLNEHLTDVAVQAAKDSVQIVTSLTE